MKSKADFIYEIIDGIVCIRDQDLGNISVTNDAENVIADIELLEGSLKDFPVVYQDSDYTWDRIIVSQTGKIYFSSLNANSKEEAINKVKSLHK